MKCYGNVLSFVLLYWFIRNVSCECDTCFLAQKGEKLNKICEKTQIHLLQLGDKAQLPIFLCGACIFPGEKNPLTDVS